MTQTASVVAGARRLVVKVGSSLVTADGRGLDHQALSGWARQIAALMQEGRQVVLVSSGAIAEGMQRLGLSRRPKAVNELQAAAAVGQMGLVEAYERIFALHGLHTAQILLTHDDMAHRTRYLNARTTLKTLLDLRVLPIVNENDTVAIDEIRLGDNDTLGALVTNLIDADALVILTDQSGLYTADPRRDPAATLVAIGEAGDVQLEKMAGGAGSSIGRGGMITKILAAKRAAQSGAHTVIASGHEPDVLLRLFEGAPIGTLLIAPALPLASRKQWLAGHLQVAGRLVLDEGAARAICSEGKSLLPIGVKHVFGEFQRGAVVACVSEQGTDIARGLTNYSSDEASRIAGHASRDIDALLGYGGDPEIIHRDNLALL